MQQSIKLVHEHLPLTTLKNVLGLSLVKGSFYNGIMTYRILIGTHFNKPTVLQSQTENLSMRNGCQRQLVAEHDMMILKKGKFKTIL